MVKACIENGAHCIDICGEPQVVGSVITQHHHIKCPSLWLNSVPSLASTSNLVLLLSITVYFCLFLSISVFTETTIVGCIRILGALCSYHPYCQHSLVESSACLLGCTPFLSRRCFYGGLVLWSVVPGENATGVPQQSDGQWSVCDWQLWL